MPTKPLRRHRSKYAGVWWKSIPGRRNRRCNTPRQELVSLGLRNSKETSIPTPYIWESKDHILPPEILHPGQNSF